MHSIQSLKTCLVERTALTMLVVRQLRPGYYFCQINFKQILIKNNLNKKNQNRVNQETNPKQDFN